MDFETFNPYDIMVSEGKCSECYFYNTYEGLGACYASKKVEAFREELEEMYGDCISTGIIFLLKQTEEDSKELLLPFPEPTDDMPF